MQFYLFWGPIIFILTACTSSQTNQKNAKCAWDKAVLYPLKLKYQDTFEPGYFLDTKHFDPRYFGNSTVLDSVTAQNLFVFSHDKNNFQPGDLATCFDECVIAYYRAEQLIETISFSCNFGQVHARRTGDSTQDKVLKDTDNPIILKVYKLFEAGYQK